MQGLVVAFYLAVVYALNIPVKAADLSVIVPLSIVVQMLPVSVNGFGVREATFSFYFTSCRSADRICCPAVARSLRV